MKSLTWQGACDSMDNWLRVIVGLQVTTMSEHGGGFVALIRLIA